MESRDIAMLHQLVDTLLTMEEQHPITTPHTPQDYHAQIDMVLQEDGMDNDALVDLVTSLLHATPKTTTSRFFNQLYGGRQPIATIGDILAVLLNTSMYTYKVAGPMVLIEQLLLRDIADRVGYGAAAKGTMAAGGSMTNLMAMIMARDCADLSASAEGIRLPLVGYSSEASHYSIAKNAAFIGVGRSAIRKVPTDGKGVMDVAQLEMLIKQDVSDGLIPFFVNATAGTTVMGAFDDVAAIHAVTARYSTIWLHVDGAYCGAVIYSKRYHHLVRGSDQAHSFSINAHKMLGTPLSTSLIVVRDGKQLHESFANDANYLYQTADDNLNPGKISLQCGRRNDALKFWMLYKSIGSSGLEQMVDHQMHLAAKARAYVSQAQGYTLYSNDNTVAVCFNYMDIPAPQLCLDLYDAGELMVGHGSFDGVVFVRLVIVNATNTWVDIESFFKRLEAFVAKHYQAKTIMV